MPAPDDWPTLALRDAMNTLRDAVDTSKDPAAVAYQACMVLALAVLGLPGRAEQDRLAAAIPRTLAMYRYVLTGHPPFATIDHDHAQADH